MGHRTLKRVRLDFDWPLGRPWEGYINPYPEPLQCNLCDGSGLNTATKQIKDDFYDNDGFGVCWNYECGIAPDGTPTDHPPWQVVGDCYAWKDKITQDEVQALLDAGRLWEFTRVPLNEKQKEDVRKNIETGGNSWLPYDNGHIPTAEEVNAWQARGGLIHSHDDINQMILVETRAKRLGVYGLCPVCKGEGELPHPDEAVRKLYEEWTEYEPPTGEGYQLWDTSGGDCPTSPVFASAEELADWCTDNATIFGSQKTSRDNWLKMFNGEKDLENGSLLVATPGYVGAAVNEPEKG